MYNEDLLKEAGVTIEQATASYDALYEAAKKATKVPREAGLNSASCPLADKLH